MMRRQSTNERKRISDEELRRLERSARHWELKHHIAHKVLMSPAVAASILALFGTFLTVALGYQNLKLQEQLEAAREENTLIIEALKADKSKPLSRLRVLTDTGLLPTFGKKLQQRMGEFGQKTSEPAD